MGKIIPFEFLPGNTQCTECKGRRTVVLGTTGPRHTDPLLVLCNMCKGRGFIKQNKEEVYVK